MPAHITYNPGILGEEELARSFVVRQQSLEMILETLRENIGSPSNRHLLMIGPRGIGKTMLVRRAALAVWHTPELRDKWYPLVFGEESYPVTTPGEFWLEAIFHLADQTGEPRYQKAFEELRSERNDARLRERALGQLLDFADGQKKRILLVVENLNMLVGEQMDQHAAWELRHTLLNEPRLMLLGTATNRFDQIENAGHAWFEMFSVHKLETLNLDECGVLWQTIAGSPLARNPLKAIRILTGGNPRLVTILASFAAKRSFRQLMEQLVHLIDDHTEYFRGHLEALGKQERRVFVALLERWDPGGAAEIAEQTRMGVNEVSTLMGRLCDRGAVEVAQQKGRKKLYQASERLYNIYYLMRRRGQPEDRVRAAVQFMVTFYERGELVLRLAELAKEACDLPEAARQDHYRAFTEVIRRVQHITRRVLKVIPAEFLHAADPELMRVVGLSELTGKAYSLMHEGQVEDAQKLFRQLLAHHDKNPVVWMGYALILGSQAQWQEAEQAARRALGLQGDGMPWQVLGIILLEQERWQEAKAALMSAANTLPREAFSWESLAQAHLHLREFDGAEQAIRTAIELDPNGQGWAVLADIFVQQDRWDEACEAMSHAVKLDSANWVIWSLFGTALSATSRDSEAATAFRRAIDLTPTSGPAWSGLGVVLFNLGQLTEAEQALRHATKSDPGTADNWERLAYVLAAAGQHHQAEETWKEGLKLHSEALAPKAFNLLELQFQRGVDLATILKDAAYWVTQSKRDTETMASMARFVAYSGLFDGLSLAEDWAREAYSRSPGTETAEALTVVLAEMRRWKAAIASCEMILDAAAGEEHARNFSTEFLIAAAAAGFAKDALAAIEKSNGATSLEPLSVGLQIYLGGAPVVAKEIFEIGQDVAERIHAAASSQAYPVPAARDRGLVERAKQQLSSALSGMVESSPVRSRGKRRVDERKDSSALPKAQRAAKRSARKKTHSS